MERKRAITSELATVRGRAANWSKSLGAVLVAALAFSLIKGQSDITALQSGAASLVGVLMLAVCVLAAVAGFLLFRASFGSLWSLKADTSDHAEAESTMAALRAGLIVSVLAVAALIVAVGVTWFGPSKDGPVLQVVDGNSETICGSVIRVNAGKLTIKVAGVERVVDLTAAQEVTPRDSCGDTQGS